MVQIIVQNLMIQMVHCTDGTHISFMAMWTLSH